MIRRYIGPLLLLAAIVVGDQIRINRPDHKYRLTVEVETPDGIKSTSGVMSVHPDRGYSQGGKTRTKGDALAIDVNGKPLLVLLAHQDDKFDLEDVSFIPVRAFAAAGQRAVFKYMDRVKGSAPVTGTVVPVMATFANPADPASMKAVKPDDFQAAFGPNVRLRGMTVAIVANGYWPLDFGGALGEPVTRGIAKTLPWLNAETAATAIKAAGWTLKPGDEALKAFTR